MATAAYTGMMEVMNSEGDLKIMWDKEVAEEVEHAADTFKRLRKEGYRAFSAGRDGSKGKRIDDFDPSIERMILVKQYQGG